MTIKWNAGDARTQSPPTKNYAPESPRLGDRRLQPSKVQCHGLDPREPTAWSRYPLCQVSYFGWELLYSYGLDLSETLVGLKWLLIIFIAQLVTLRCLHSNVLLHSRYCLCGWLQQICTACVLFPATIRLGDETCTKVCHQKWLRGLSSCILLLVDHFKGITLQQVF